MSTKLNGLPQHVTRQQAADALLIGLRQLDRLVRDGKMKKVKLSKRRSAIPLDDLTRYLREQHGERVVCDGGDSD
jgi:predicted site-specific integrase-resolvase